MQCLFVLREQFYRLSLLLLSGNGCFSIALLLAIIAKLSMVRAFHKNENMQLIKQKGVYIMFHGAIKTNIPLELEEAATIDGCSRWQTYWKVVFPLLKPTIATVAIINAMAYWNDYLLPSLVLTKKELYTIPIATQAFYGTYSTDIGLVMAALLLAMLPILVLYVFLQKYIVQGVTAGSVKG